jgi:S1-C subfamily serine protease
VAIVPEPANWTYIVLSFFAVLALMVFYSLGVWVRTHIFASSNLLSKWQLLAAVVPVGFIIMLIYARSAFPALSALPYNAMFFEGALELSFAFMLGMLSREALERLVREVRRPPVIRKSISIREQAKESIVFLRRITRALDGNGERVEETATGFIVSVAGHIITAAHLLSEEGDGKEVHYSASPGPNVNLRWRTDVIDQNRGLDVALLQLQHPATWTPLLIGASTNLTNDARLITLGFPLGGDLASAEGLLSNRSGKKGLFQTTLPINRGNSGGPVFASDTIEARVIGVAAGGVDEAQGITFVIPSNHLKNLLHLAGVDILTDQPAEGSRHG